MNYIAQDKKAIFLTNNPDFGSQTWRLHVFQNTKWVLSLCNATITPVFTK